MTRKVLIAAACIVASVAMLAAGSKATASPLPLSVLESMWQRTMEKRHAVNRELERIDDQIAALQGELRNLGRVASTQGWSEDDYYIAFGEIMQQLAEFQIERTGVDAKRVAIYHHLLSIDAQMEAARQDAERKLATTAKEKPHVVKGICGTPNPAEDPTDEVTVPLPRVLLPRLAGKVSESEPAPSN